MRKLFRLAVSRTTAIALMIAMASFLALASFVPAPDLAPERIEELRRTRPVAMFLVERLRPEETARSPAFVALAALVFFSTAFSIYERVRGEVWRRRNRPAAPLERFRAVRTIECRAEPDCAAAAVRGVLAGAGHRTEEEPAPEGGRALVATRGAAGFWGSIVFHVGILVTMVAVGVSARTRFNGEVLLVEGIARPFAPGIVFGATRPAMLRDLSGFAVGIRDFQAQYDRGYGKVDFAALFDVASPGRPRRTEVVRVNQPVDVGGFQLTLYRYGFAPELAVKAGSAVLADAITVLRVIPPGTEDSIALADGSALHVALYPDHARSRGRPVSRSMAPVHPVLAVRHVVNGTDVARGEVPMGEDARIGALEVSFPALRYWADFQIGRDRGLAWFAMGSGLVALGLGLRFLFDPRTVRVLVWPTAAGARVEMIASARYFPAFNDERADALARSLGAALGVRAGPSEAA